MGHPAEVMTDRDYLHAGRPRSAREGRSLGGRSHSLSDVPVMASDRSHMPGSSAGAPWLQATRSPLTGSRGRGGRGTCRPTRMDTRRYRDPRRYRAVSDLDPPTGTGNTSGTRPGEVLPFCREGAAWPALRGGSATSGHAPGYDHPRPRGGLRNDRAHRTAATTRTSPPTDNIQRCVAASQWGRKSRVWVPTSD